MGPAGCCSPYTYLVNTQAYLTGMLLKHLNVARCGMTHTQINDCRDQASACLLQTGEPLSAVGQSSLIDVKDCDLRPVWLNIALVKEIPAGTCSIISRTEIPYRATPPHMTWAPECQLFYCSAGMVHASGKHCKGAWCLPGCAYCILHVSVILFLLHNLPRGDVLARLVKGHCL